MEIESNIPIPPAGNKGFTKVLRELKKGQSVVIPTTNGGAARNIAMYALGVGNYSCRKADDGYRVWRIK